MSEPKISVIIPVYNVEKYIHQCLDSILNQSLKDIEVICVDDESPDNCPKILDDYAKDDDRLKVIHKQNEGQGVARNTALKIAKGEYIIFVDSDDWLENNALEKLYNKIKKDDSDVVCFNAYRFYEKTNTKNVYYFTEPYYRKFKERVFSPSEAKGILYLTNALPFKIYKRMSLEKYNFYYTKQYCWEDHLPFFTFLARAQRISVLNDCIYTYRVRTSSTTFSSFNCKNDCLNNFFLCCKEMENCEETKKFFYEFLSYKIRNFFFHLSLMNLLQKRKFYKDIQKAFRYIHKNYSEDKLKNESYFQYYKLVLYIPFEIFFLYTRIIRTILLIRANRI